MFLIDIKNKVMEFNLDMRQYQHYTEVKFLNQ